MRLSVKRSSGLTLVEVMLSVAILAVAALGTLGYQYHAARHSHIAKVQITGARISQLLIEDWKSTGGSETYDPTFSGMGFIELSIPGSFIEGQDAGTPVGNSVYNITVDDVPMQTMLSWMDIEVDASTGVTLRQLTVILKFRDDPEIDPIIVSSYIRVDAASG